MTGDQKTEAAIISALCGIGFGLLISNHKYTGGGLLIALVIYCVGLLVSWVEG